jgi:hypothetical protein
MFANVVGTITSTRAQLGKAERNILHKDRTIIKMFVKQPYSHNIPKYIHFHPLNLAFS